MERSARTEPREIAQQPDSSAHDQRELSEQLSARLARIQQLWHELQATDHDSLQHEALTLRIRQEADAYSARLAALVSKP
jgi:hypothetical protein